MKYLVIIVFAFILSCKSTHLYDKPMCEIEGTIKVYDNTLEITNLDSLYIPDSLFEYTNIQIIFITSSYCVNSNYLFESLSRFKKLEKLFIHNCNIESIPDNVDKLFLLKTLRISNDNLYSISSNIKNTNINSLILENTNIGKLDFEAQTKMFKSIATISTLNYLSVYNNQIEILPEVLSNCNISKLDIGKNKFKKIPSILIRMMNDYSLVEVMIDYSPFLLLTSSKLGNVVKKDRRTYHFNIYFDKKLTNDFTIDIMSKLEKKYTAIEIWGTYTLRY